MGVSKPEPGSLSTDLLPTPEVLADDLKEIVHKLAEWKSRPLLALRSLPSVRFARASDVGPHQGPPSNGVIPQRVGAAVSRLADARKQEALRALFTWNDLACPVGERLKKAAATLGVQYDTFRKGAEADLLEALASEMFRGELAWAIYQFEPMASIPGDWGVSSWYELIELERSLVIDGDDSRKQTWTTRMRMRCVKHDLPLLVTSQRWTGGGTDKASREPGKITILPGTLPTRGSPRRPEAKLMDCRRYSDNELSFYVYLWNLAEIRPVGEEFEHSWQQELIDEVGSFRPYIGFGTESFPTTTRIRLRVKLPYVNANVLGRHLTTRNGSVSSTYAGAALTAGSAPIPIKQTDSEGYYTYEPEEVIYPDVYEIWWGDDIPPGS